MSITLPSQGGKWRVGNNGFADIVEARAMDFSETGVAKLAKPPIALYTNTEDSDFGVVKAIVGDYVFTAGNVFLLNTRLGTMTEVTASGMPDLLSTATDAVYYDGEYLVSAATSVYSTDGASWAVASGITGLNAVPHPLCVFENRTTLCIGNGSEVKQTNPLATSLDGTNVLSIPVEFYVTWMRWRGNNLYIGTRNITGGAAKMFIWNGSGVYAQHGYTVSCDWIYSGCDYKDSMVILTSTGQLLRFNGGGFDELAHLPVYETPFSWSKSNAAAASTLGRCDNRGMIAHGETLYLNIDGAVQGNPEITYLPNQPSGLWAYEPGVGLYHVAGYSHTKYNVLTITALSSNTLTVGNHLLETGDEVRAVSVSNITGLTATRDYFVIKVSSTTIKLALSAADAYAGRNLTLSGTPSGDTLAANRTNRGATTTLVPGAVALVTDTATHNQFFDTEILFAGTSQNASNTAIRSLMSFGVGRNNGSFTTSQIPSDKAKDTFQKLCLYCKGLNLDTESIVVKYRTSEKFGLPTPLRISDTGLATWVDSSTFTILTTAKDVQSAAVGDEVEITEGAGAGYTAHISSIDTSTSTYSFVIDEVIPNIAGGDTSEVIINNWKKIGTITNTTDSIADDFAEIPLGDKAAWAQFKVELRGKQIPISKMSIITTTDKPS